MPSHPLLAAYVVRLFGHPGRIDGVELHDLCRGDTHKHETLHAALTALRAQLGEDGTAPAIEPHPESPASPPDTNPWR